MPAQHPDRSPPPPGQSADSIVYVIDDDLETRNAVGRLVASAGLPVECFETAQEFLVRHRPDVPSCMILDFGLPGLSGLDLQRELARDHAGIPIVFLSGTADIPTSVEAMKAGAVEFLTKPVAAEPLLEAIDRALQRDRCERRQRQELSALRTRHASLTPRQREVMSLIVSGLMNKQVASELGIGEITVKIHRARVMQKMQVGSLAELARIAERLGLP